MQSFWNVKSMGNLESITLVTSVVIVLRVEIRLTAIRHVVILLHALVHIIIDGVGFIVRLVHKILINIRVNFISHTLDFLISASTFLDVKLLSLLGIQHLSPSSFNVVN